MSIVVTHSGTQKIFLIQIESIHLGIPNRSIDFVKSFCYLGDRLNASGGSEAAVTATTRIGWIKFKECGELLCGKKFLLKMKERIIRVA